MDTELLRTFVEVSHTRHFGRAAENLYLTQSAISFRIRQLEQQLGVALFSRHRNNIQLTASGERFLPYAQSMLATLARAKQEVGVSAEHKPQIAIGAPALFWECDFPPCFDALIKQSHAFTLYTRSGSREQLNRQLLAQELDAIVLFEASKIDEIISPPIAPLAFELVSADPNLTLATLVDVPFISLDVGAERDLSLPWPIPQQANSPIYLSALHTARQYLMAHGGAAYLPRLAIAPWLRDGHLHIVAGSQTYQQACYIGYLAQKPRPAFVEVLLR